MFDEAIARLKMQLHKTSVPLSRFSETKTRGTSAALRGAAGKATVQKRRHTHEAAATRRRQAKRDLKRIKLAA
jgi:hypothetical protein